MTPSSSDASWTVNQSPLRVSAPGRAAGPPPAGHGVQPQPHLALPEQLGQGARRGHPALVEDHHPVADPLDLADEVGVEQHGDAAGLQREHEVADVDPAERVERAGRLVEDDELRPGDQRDGEPEPLLHALGEPARPGRRPGRPARPGPGTRAALGGGDVDPGEPDVQVQRPRPAVSHGW